MRQRGIAAVLSTLFMGLGQLYNRQYIKGLLFAAIEVSALIWLMPNIGKALWGVYTLGEKTQGFQKVGKLNVRVEGDHSIYLLISGLITLFVLAIFILIYIMTIRDAYRTGKSREAGIAIPSFQETLAYVTDKKFPLLMLSVPIIGVLFLTVMPIVFMIMLAFTNYAAPNNIPPKSLVDWVGFDTFANLVTLKTWSATFIGVATWTIIWAIIATVTTYIGGILVALLIESKGVYFKKMWRTIFILPYAIPQLISLLVMRNLFNGQFGPINQYLGYFGLGKLPWLTDPFWAKVTVIMVNMWIGIPVSMVLILGILTAIPKDMYEAAEVDGATSFQKFRIITMPFILFSTVPILITQFAGNINNFSVIFLLTNGDPVNGDYQYAGSTDLLVTWLYKLTLNNSQFNMSSAIGIVIFLIVASFSIWNYRRSRSFKEEDMIQ
ncbi:carbohydrate ABC transporter permease [Paenibacillus herberti]|uniref:Maltose/maltodextrin transport system permease protein n=1 Tax=Paenibacillus herberti TaxID=1619309 RepID=A0A229P118_9BACL|nr:sugar ABC transporter permease [Paenibacillus herberti]OXM15892.1 sugar ABC transporter permease [Paenibacillus herberti]